MKSHMHGVIFALLLVITVDGVGAEVGLGQVTATTHGGGGYARSHFGIVVDATNNPAYSASMVGSAILVAQATAAATISPSGTFMEGMTEGSMMGRNTASGWSFTGGFGAGLVLGVVGTAVAYFGQRPDPIPLQEIHRIAPKGQDFLAGYTNAFEKSSKEKDQRAALGGGLLGTIVVVTIVLSAGS